MKIYKAYYDSRNFSFEAFSRTKESALYHCKQGLLRHGEQYKLEPDWFMYDDLDCIEVAEYDIDHPYRDRSKIK